MTEAAGTQELADRWGERLPRRLGLLSAVAVVIGSTIGSGIYRTPARIAEAVPAPGWMLGVWVLGGLLALCGALTYAELGGMFPRSGGVFIYIKEGFGRMPAFLFGWTELVVIRASALGAIATVFAEYLLRSLGYDPKVYADAVHYVAAGAIALTGICNYVGVDWSALLLNVTTWVRYFALVALVILAFLLGHGDTTHFVQADGAVHFEPFVASLVAVLWAYDGWGDVSFVGGEVANPERNLPRAFIIGTLGVIAIYLAVNVAYLYLLPISLERHSPLVAADAAQLIVGRAGVAVIGIVVVISTFGTLAGSMLTGPRIFFAMADAGLFFKGIAAVHPRFKTPSRAITLASVLAIIFVLIRRFEGLSDTFVLAIWPFYALAAAAAMVLRHKNPSAPRPVRTLAYPLPPLIFILSAALILTVATIASPKVILLGLPVPRDTAIPFGVILAGVPAWFIWRSRQATKA